MRRPKVLSIKKAVKGIFHGWLLLFLYWSAVGPLFWSTHGCFTLKCVCVLAHAWVHRCDTSNKNNKMR